MTEDEMVGWHHGLNGHEFEQTPGDGEGQGSLVCCSPWGCKESDTTKRLNNKNGSGRQADEKELRNEVKSENVVAQLHPTLCDPMTVARQAPLSMEFSRQEYWSGLPFPSPKDLPNPGLEPRSPALQADSLPSAVSVNKDATVISDSSHPKMNL